MAWILRLGYDSTMPLKPRRRAQPSPRPTTAGYCLLDLLMLLMLAADFVMSLESFLRLDSRGSTALAGPDGMSVGLSRRSLVQPKASIARDGQWLIFDALIWVRWFRVKHDDAWAEIVCIAMPSSCALPASKWDDVCWLVTGDTVPTLHSCLIFPGQAPRRFTQT